jgi:hypothetical protein
MRETNVPNRSEQWKGDRCCCLDGDGILSKAKAEVCCFFRGREGALCEENAGPDDVVVIGEGTESAFLSSPVKGRTRADGGQRASPCSVCWLRPRKACWAEGEKDASEPTTSMRRITYGSLARRCRCVLVLPRANRSVGMVEIRCGSGGVSSSWQVQPRCSRKGRRVSIQVCRRK